MSDQPFTVADLRKWASEAREEAIVWERIDITAARTDALAKELVRRFTAHAAAFDALADALEACAVRCESTDSLELSDAFVRGNNEARREIGRILSGVKP